MAPGDAMSLLESIGVAVGGLALSRLINLVLDRLSPGQATSAPASVYPDHPWPIGLLPLVGRRWPNRHRCSGHGLGRLRPLAVAAVTALVCGWATHQFGVTLGAGVAILYSVLFIHLAFADLEHSTIPNWVVLPAIPLGLALFPLSPLGHGWSLEEAYLRSLGGGAVGFGLMLLVFIAARGRLGGGDVKLAGLLGVTLGLPYALAGLVLGVAAGGLAALALLALRVKHPTDTMPYGPALISGAAVVLLSGGDISQWYFQLLR